MVQGVALWFAQGAAPLSFRRGKADVFQDLFDFLSGGRYDGEASVPTLPVVEFVDLVERPFNALLGEDRR